MERSGAERALRNWTGLVGLAPQAPEVSDVRPVRLCLDSHGGSPRDTNRPRPLRGAERPSLRSDQRRSVGVVPDVGRVIVDRGEELEALSVRQAEFVESANGSFEVGDRSVEIVGVELFGEIGGVGVDHRLIGVGCLIHHHAIIISFRNDPVNGLRPLCYQSVPGVLREPWFAAECWPHPVSEECYWSLGPCAVLDKSGPSWTSLECEVHGRELHRSG